MNKSTMIRLLLLCLLFAGAPRLGAADKKAGKQRTWVVHQFPSWEISTPEGFGFQVRQSGEDYREWWRTWDKQLPSRPGEEIWITYSERIFAAAGKNKNADCGAKDAPISRDDRETVLAKTRVTAPIAGSHYGIPTSRFTIYSERTDRGEKCMERDYAVGGVPGEEGEDKRIEVTYTYRVSYRGDMVPAGAAPSVKNGGPNFQTYLQMLTTLKPRAEKSPDKSGAGTVQLLQ